MWQRLIDRLALTSTERKVILFLAGTLLLGAGIRLYKETFPSTQTFDYRASDSTFADLNRKLKTDSFAGQQQGNSLRTININTATKQELMLLPGIGEVFAERILQRRKENGSYKTVDDLLKIKGMSKKRLEQIKNFITIDTAMHIPGGSGVR